jgi:hypothetical protein
VDLITALDQTSDVLELAEIPELIGEFKTIMTTNLKEDTQAETGDNPSEFQKIKKALMGDQKALIIQINEEQR